MFLRVQQRKEELSDLLSVMTLGSRGDPEAVEKQIKQWEEET